MRALLGIDVGTSGTKTVLFDEKGRPLASHTEEYPMLQPQNGWAEQQPEDWWRALVLAIRSVLSKSGLPAYEIAGVGLSGQMHGLVMLGKDDEVLRPAIIWCDQRTGEECDDLNRIIGPRRMIEITANPPMTGFTASKILWVQKHEPEIYDKCVKILLPKDYIRFKLTGEFATEVSDASGMQLMDVPGRVWSNELLSKLNIDKSMLGRIYESPDVTGKVSRQAAGETGLAEGTIVVGGAADNAAAAIGTGVTAEGSPFTTIGTSGVIYAVSNEPHVDMEGRVHTLCASVPGKWTVMSCTQAAGLSLKWLRDTCCAPEMAKAEGQGIDPYVIMSKLAEGVPAGAGKLVFLPYLMGERSPHPDADCRGVFFGLSAMHTRANMIRAVMEGVSYSLLECVDVLREMGVPVQGMTICGGGSRSPLWRQMLADLYECPVHTLKVDEGASLGAALLAGVGAGIFSSVEETSSIVQKNEPVFPDAGRHREYMPYYQLYKSLYPTLKDSFKELAGL